MKTILKNVYYCDFCKKKGLAFIHIKNHEERCTANPNRVCKLCEQDIELAEFVEKLKARFKIVTGVITVTGNEWNEPMELEEETCEWIGEQVTLKEIRDYADNCPACILAILRQTSMNRYWFSEQGFDKFDYKAESKIYYDEKMRRNNEPEYHY